MSMRELKEAVSKCHGCEDRTGHPYCGTGRKAAGRALRDAGLERSSVYITNAVKHFKFEERGKRRIHKKPNTVEIRSCRPWLEAEMELIRPGVLLCLGATAAQTVFGSAYRLTKERRQFIAHPWAPYATSTIHPSAILRMPDAGERQAEYARFVADLKLVQAQSLT